MRLAETKHRMGRRCNGWDYSQRAIYMVTLNLKERGRPVLAEWPVRLAVSGEAQNSGGNWACPRTPLGEKVLSCWRRIPEFWPQVALLAAVVMPDHFHGIYLSLCRVPGIRCLLAAYRYCLR